MKPRLPPLLANVLSLTFLLKVDDDIATMIFLLLHCNLGDPIDGVNE